LGRWLRTIRPGPWPVMLEITTPICCALNICCVRTNNCAHNFSVIKGGRGLLWGSRGKARAGPGTLFKSGTDRVRAAGITIDAVSSAPNRKDASPWKTAAHDTKTVSSSKSSSNRPRAGFCQRRVEFSRKLRNAELRGDAKRMKSRRLPRCSPKGGVRQAKEALREEEMMKTPPKRPTGLLGRHLRWTAARAPPVRFSRDRRAARIKSNNQPRMEGFDSPAKLMNREDVLRLRRVSDRA